VDPKRTAKQLAAAIRCQTVSVMEGAPPDHEAMQQLHAVIQKQYPLVHKTSPAQCDQRLQPGSTPGSAGSPTCRPSCSPPTRTWCPPIPRAGATRPSPVRSPTASCGAAAPWT
jgi:hypothetical protein